MRRILYGAEVLLCSCGNHKGAAGDGFDELTNDCGNCNPNVNPNAIKAGDCVDHNCNTFGDALAHFLGIELRFQCKN